MDVRESASDRGGPSRLPTTSTKKADVRRRNFSSAPLWSLRIFIASWRECRWVARCWRRRRSPVRLSRAEKGGGLRAERSGAFCSFWRLIAALDRKYEKPKSPPGDYDARNGVYDQRHYRRESQPGDYNLTSTPNISHVYTPLVGNPHISARSGDAAGRCYGSVVGRRRCADYRQAHSSGNARYNDRARRFLNGQTGLATS